MPGQRAGDGSRRILLLHGCSLTPRGHTLRSIEDIFGLAHLGDAAMPQVKAFGPDVYSNS